MTFCIYMFKFATQILFLKRDNYLYKGTKLISTSKGTIQYEKYALKRDKKLQKHTLSALRSEHRYTTMHTECPPWNVN